MGEWTRARLTEFIHRVLRDELLAPGDGFAPTSNLVASGLDSLAVTQLMLSIEEATGVWVDESLLTPENLESSESLAACIHEHLARR
jgi:acyl carrier protein